VVGELSGEDLAAPSKCTPTYKRVHIRSIYSDRHGHIYTHLRTHREHLRTLENTLENT
jgi:hypothetical protein